VLHDVVGLLACVVWFVAWVPVFLASGNLYNWTEFGSTAFRSVKAAGV